MFSIIISTVTLTLDEGDLVECDNIYIGSGDPETRGAAFDPADYYSYALDDARDVPRLVKVGAGPRFIAPSVADEDDLPIDQLAVPSLPPGNDNNPSEGETGDDVLRDSI
jgi:hypothetical protein